MATLKLWRVSESMRRRGMTKKRKNTKALFLNVEALALATGCSKEESYQIQELLAFHFLMIGKDVMIDSSNFTEKEEERWRGIAIGTESRFEIEV